MAYISCKVKMIFVFNVFPIVLIEFEYVRKNLK